ncbi:class I SAM-dependent methyltransferase [Bdellovibrionota bacterium FG-1]
MQHEPLTDFKQAWKWRQSRGLFAESQALRVFHGPGEGQGALAEWAVDRFGDHYWLTCWGAEVAANSPVVQGFVAFYRAQGALSIVLLGRPEKGVPSFPVVVHGTPPPGRFEVDEKGVRFLIQLQETRHPGLFLDHAPLRAWLKARSQGWRVLNTFAYTGSLSVAAGVGGADQVTTLDLSKPTVKWAEENWSVNHLDPARARWIAGDVFEWLPRLSREGKKYDCVILDPPSFAHGKKGGFSTAKDLQRLHELAMGLLDESGVLVTSINSANVTWARYEADVLAAARQKKMKFDVLARMDLPENFPTAFEGSRGADDRYLKGWILRRRD